jgi:RNA polymerase sigma-70 factor (ECF subfamily)
MTAAPDLHRDLIAALAHLDPDDRLALHLHYPQDRSHAEIAALPDWPVGTAKTHLPRGKTGLRPLLAVWNLQT